jgi:release factor glutamine methyltransferase
LIPRPDTERLVELALAAMGESGALLDVGVGSGAIAVTLLCEKPAWRGVGVDLSETALATTAHNAERHGVAQRLELRRSDLFAAVSGETFDLIVANPPYIATGDLATLDPDVGRYEPREALDGGADGLDVVRRLAAEGAERLRPGGRIFVEIGQGQAEAARAIFDAWPWRGATVHEDYAGTGRVVEARRD